LKYLKNSKWTATQKIYNWRHYEVLNINNKTQQVEMFAVCDKKIKIIVSFEDLKNPLKWTKGWLDIVEQPSSH
jgi:tryptophan-rich hypothetical protein